MPWILKHPWHSRRTRRVTNVNATLGATSLSLYTFPRARTRNRLIQTRRESAVGRRTRIGKRSGLSARVPARRGLFPLIRVAWRTRAIGMPVVVVGYYKRQDGAT